MLWDWYVSGSDGGGGNFEQAYIVEFRAPGASAMPMTWEVYPGSGHYSQLAALYGGWRAVERSEADIRSAFEAVREHCAGTAPRLPGYGTTGTPRPARSYLNPASPPSTA